MSGRAWPEHRTSRAPDMPDSHQDQEQLIAAGIPESEVERQLEMLTHPPEPPRLVRPCTLGDGILQISRSEQDDLVSEWQRAAAAGRFTKFVPASGAASRLFQGLDDPQSAESQRWAQRANAFPPVATLRELPKGLLPFHHYGDETRRAFTEQLVEGVGHLSDEHGRCRYHFTVAAPHRDRFEHQLARDAVRLKETRGISVEVDFSTQDPATDTVALDESGSPARASNGELLLRPSGHGALIDNLERLDADLVFIKNIDNIQPEAGQQRVIHWKRVLAGLLVRMAREHQEPTPMRVCGMVRNTGEPGGGPFWVEDRLGEVRPQIVEIAQVSSAADQQDVVAGSTHFNPVDLVCSMRGADGSGYALTDFIDPEAIVVTTKTHEGQKIRTLERPGLWNGAMAGWKTVFVEVPEETFTPVKTVLDLLRPEHIA